MGMWPSDMNLVTFAALLPLGILAVILWPSATNGDIIPMTTAKMKYTNEPYFYNVSKRFYTAAVGQSAYLRCIVKNLGDREVSWIRKRDLHILSVGVHTYSSDARFAAIHTEGSDDWTLRVATVQLSDSGAYECQVSTEPKISLSFNLSVVVSKAEILTGAEVLVRAGSDINLTCRVTHASEPPSYIYWYRGNNMITYTLRGGISVETEQLTKSSRLLIARATTKDSGNYTCAPSNSDTASIFVHVVNGERPEAMQSDARKIYSSAYLILIMSLFNDNLQMATLSTNLLFTLEYYLSVLIEQYSQYCKSNELFVTS